MIQKVLVIVLLTCYFANAQFTKPNSYVHYDSETGAYTATLYGGSTDNAVAVGNFANVINETGWTQLFVNTSNSFDDAIAMYAAGYLEGALTQQLIYLQHRTYQQSVLNFKPAVLQFMKDNDLWTKQQVKDHPTDPYWIHVGLVLNQLQGLVDGYNAFSAEAEKLTYADLLLINLLGDVLTLQDAVASDAERPDWLHMSREELRSALLVRNHCSGLVRLTDTFDDLFISHTTWAPYQYMLRIFRAYNFPLKAERTNAERIVFSGFPATLASTDDFWMTSQNLALLETTNDVFNTSLYANMKPDSGLMYWIRAIVASRMARSGLEWMQVFAEQNAGTYNDQWVVVDYKLFTPNQPLLDGLVYVGEQIPGLFYYEDVTEMVSLGYWPSYNIPFFPHIYNISGYPAMEAKYGTGFSYELCPRAQLFRRDVSRVNDMNAMKTIMQYNDFQKDPLSHGNPDDAIAARADLSPHNPAPFGGLDSKITSSQLIKRQQAWIIAGPTHQQQKPFEWSEFPDIAHFGQPEVCNFDWHISST
eukprot:TRINITY_DN13325_c0_g1_i1.p1 TRINITY_DN13325_c0_g1~~TRINITY_DN13325_c0_g1_i1.p1  ORF type:complete len:531 (-),score=108.45 TRINITY_DN13325_c0_g1_i1:54-1646(-)